MLENPSRKLSISRKLFMVSLSFGICIWRICLVLFGSRPSPPLNHLCPNNYTSLSLNWSFSLFSLRWLPLVICRKFRKLQSCSSSDFPMMIIAIVDCSKLFWNPSLLTTYPIGSLVHTYLSLGNDMAVYIWESGCNLTYQNLFFMSTILKYCTLWNFVVSSSTD